MTGKTTNKFSPEVRARAVRLVLDHEVGDSCDNALAERSRSLQSRGHPQTGPWRNYQAVEFATLDWVDWFSNRRLLGPIGNIPPAEAEERYYVMLDQPAMAA